MPRNAAAKLAGAAPVFAALGDPLRLRLVARLSREGPLSLSHLSEGTEVTRQGVTKHLRVLEQAGVVHGERRGREAIWELESARLEEAKRSLDEISRQWDGALGRLRRLVEE